MASDLKPGQAPHQESGSALMTDSSGRYVALSYTLTATYHKSWGEAEHALAAIPSSRRAAIVDSQTGKTLASQAAYPEVLAAVSGEVLGIMSREGPIGDLAFKRRRRAE